MLDFTKLWNVRYLFGPNPLALSRSDYIFFYAAAAFVGLSIGLKIFTVYQAAGSPKRFLINRFFRAFFTIGLLMLLWAGARYQNIPWMSAHFVVLLLGLILALWLGFILWYWITTFPHHMRRFNEESIKKKYLP